MNIKDAYIHNGDAILKDIQLSGSKLQKLKAGKNADDTYLTWVDVLDLSLFGASGHNHDDKYVKLDGSNVMSGDLTLNLGDLDRFIVFSYPNTVNPTSDSWRTGVLRTGQEENNFFVVQYQKVNTNSSDWNTVFKIGQNTGNVTFTNNITIGDKVNYHAGNLTIKTLIGTTAIGDSDEPVYWNGSSFVKAGAYPTKASWNYDDRYLKLAGGTMSNTNIVNNLNADLLDGYHASSFYQNKTLHSDQDSIYDLRFNYGPYDKGDFNGTYKDEYPTDYGSYIALTARDKNIGALMFFDTPTSNKLGHIYVRTRGAGDRNTTYSEWGTIAYLTDNVASSSKWATPRTITLTGSVTGSVSIDGSQNVSLATTTNHTHNYLPLSGGTITSEEIAPLALKSTSSSGHSILQFISGGTYLGALGFKGLNDPYFRTTTGTFNTLIHSGNYNSYAPSLTGTGATGTWGISISGNAATATNADTLDGYHASNLVKFYLSPMASGAPADSAKSWFVNTMPSGTGAIVYNVPGSEKTIIAGKSTGTYGHMLQLNYDDNYLRMLRCYHGSWRTTDWEKVSAGYADAAKKARYLQADNDAASPEGALLRSGSGRADTSPSGDTWIFWDELGGTSSYWGIRHNQANNSIGFCGAGSETSNINLKTGKITSKGFILTGSSSSYVLLGDGGHKLESSLSVNYANSAGNAEYASSAGNAATLGGLPSSRYLTLDTEYYTNNTNADTLTGVSFYINATGNGSGNSNFPTAYGKLFSWGGVYAYTQLYADVLNNGLYFRTKSSAFNGDAWKKIAFLDSNVASSSKWATPRTITLTGSVTGSVSIDGSQNVSLDTTTNHTHTFASLTSKPTTLAGYGITDASRIFRYTIPASGNKGVRITFTANEPVKITVSGSNQHAQLVLVGTGYGAGGFIRNNFTELVHSDSGYSWCMPDEARSVEVFSTRTGADYVTVESPSPVTFTAISALSKTAVNRCLLNSLNYSSYALPLTGGTLNGWLLINASTLPISELTADTSTLDTSWNRAQNINLLLRSGNNAMTISLGGQSNERKGIIQVGHAATTYSNVLGNLYLNKFGGNVYIGENLAYHAGNCNLPTIPWTCSSLVANGSVEAKANLYGQSLEFLNINSSANHGGFIDFHFNGNTEDYTSRIIEDASRQLTLYAKTIRIGKSNSANLLFLRPLYNYIWADVAGGTLVLGTADGGQTSSSNSALFIKGKKVYIGGTETGNNALNVLGVAHATTGIYTDGYISARKQDTSSDIRLKTDFRPLDGALEYIRGTHFTRFRWKDGSGESVGIIAQEEQSREYGFLVRSHGEIGHLTYDYAASTALLGAALQEEDEKVEALKRRVKELENKLDRLKQSNYANK